MHLKTTRDCAFKNQLKKKGIKFGQILIKYIKHNLNGFFCLLIKITDYNIIYRILIKSYVFGVKKKSEELERKRRNTQSNVI